MVDQNTKIQKKRISILGCGWLGLPLAQRLLAGDISSAVKGSTTSPEKVEQFKSLGIDGYLFNLNPEISGNQDDIGSFFDSDVLIISISPKLAKNEPEFHPKQIQSVIEALKDSPVQEIIYISATSVYPELNREVREDDVKTPEDSAAPGLVKAENLLTALRENRTVSILRLGGLLGYNRIPGNYVQGQKDLTTGSIPVNYIHRDDAAGIIYRIVEQGLVNETFNVVAPVHPSRREVYEISCQQFGWEPPTFLDAGARPDFKIISAEKLNSFYAYEFKFPDPLAFFYAV
jgi:nucleoside-diphosphate-sugar epimerase